MQLSVTPRRRGGRLDFYEHCWLCGYMKVLFTLPADALPDAWTPPRPDTLPEHMVYCSWDIQRVEPGRAYKIWGTRNGWYENTPTEDGRARWLTPNREWLYTQMLPPDEVSGPFRVGETEAGDPAG